MIKNKNEQEKTNSRNKDECALFIHYAKYHPESLEKTPEIWEAYGLIFIEKPAMKDLDYRENYWIKKLNSKINIAKTYLPKYT